MVDTLYSFRADTSDVWATKNPLVPVGVPCYEVDTRQLKIGDGNTLYNDLQYFTGAVIIPVLLDDSQSSLATTYSSSKIDSLDAATLAAAQSYTDTALSGGQATTFPVNAAQQAADGTWGNRPLGTVVLALGYPGFTNPPSWLVSPSDIYFMKST